MKVGAVILRLDHSLASAGYNGLPPGIDVDWTDRNGRRRLVIHAEVNAFRYATLDDTYGGLLAVTHLPCLSCLPVVAAHGIRTVVWSSELDPDRYPQDEADELAAALGLKMYRVES